MRCSAGGAAMPPAGSSRVLETVLKETSHCDILSSFRGSLAQVDHRGRAGWGTDKPSAFAGFRLITSLYLFGACTGRFMRGAHGMSASQSLPYARQQPMLPRHSGGSLISAASA